MLPVAIICHQRNRFSSPPHLSVTHARIESGLRTHTLIIGPCPFIVNPLIHYQLQFSSFIGDIFGSHITTYLLLLLVWANPSKKPIKFPIKFPLKGSVFSNRIRINLTGMLFNHSYNYNTTLHSATYSAGRHRFTSQAEQESCAIAKTTARCALYIGYSTIILFTPICSLLCADLILNEFKLIGFSALIKCWFWTANNCDYSSTQRRMPPRAQTSFRRIVLDGDAPRRWNPCECYTLYF